MAQERLGNSHIIVLTHILGNMNIALALVSFMAYTVVSRIQHMICNKLAFYVKCQFIVSVTALAATYRRA